MPLILESPSGERVLVRNTLTLGRSVSVGLRLDASEVSLNHAEFRWTGAGWDVRDLGSRNGTFVDGDRLEPGAGRRLRTGTVLAFANQDRWRVIGTGAPVAAALSERGERIEATNNVIAIPDAEDPQLLVVATRSGWVREHADGHTEDAEDGSVVTVDGVAWQLALAEPASDTAEANQAYLAVATLKFRVSLDEEHVEFEVEAAGRTWSLPARTNHYTLLTLARCRIADMATGQLPASEHGWVDQGRLERMLQIDANLVYKHIHRARKELAELGIAGSSDIVERRVSARQLRIGCSRLMVDGL